MATRANYRTKRNHSFNTWKSAGGDSQGRGFPVTNATIFRVSERSDMELMTHNHGPSRVALAANRMRCNVQNQSHPLVYLSGPPDGQMDDVARGQRFFRLKQNAAARDVDGGTATGL
jgi:hypothetical protein